MKQISGIIVISFFAGMACFSMLERVAGGGWAHAATSQFSATSCDRLKTWETRNDDAMQRGGDYAGIYQRILVLNDVLVNEHCN